MRSSPFTVFDPHVDIIIGLVQAVRNAVAYVALFVGAFLIVGLLPPVLGFAMLVLSVLIVAATPLLAAELFFGVVTERRADDGE